MMISTGVGRGLDNLQDCTGCHGLTGLRRASRVVSRYGKNLTQERHAAARTRRGTQCAIVAFAAAMLLTGCQSPFDESDMEVQVSAERVRNIEQVDLAAQSRAEPVTVEKAAEQTVKDIVDNKVAPAVMNITLADVRAAALANNLDLRVELVKPSIAQASVDEEAAKFEATFFGSFRHVKTDSPTALGTEGSNVVFDSYDFGVDIPLQTGGNIRLDVPFSRTETNNPFSLINPAHVADARFSISQPLLRGGGIRANTHSIRIARNQKSIADARTKLEAIRILANADRAYWNLYAARRELMVRQTEYELAVTQLEQARRRVDAGDAPSIEITRAESGVAQRLEAIIIAQTLVLRRQRDLKRIMNRDDLKLTGSTALATTTDPNPLGLDLDADLLASYAVDNRMEMLELELQLASDASSIDFERNAALPLFSVDYSYSLGGLGLSYSDAFDQVADNRFQDWSVGAQLEIPLGNEAAEARVHRAILTRLQRLATKEQRIAAIRQEVFDSLDQLQQNWQRILAARIAAILAGRTFEAEQRQFNVGARTSTDVLDAAARLADAQSAEIRALADYQIALVDITFATGTLLGAGQVVWQPYEASELRNELGQPDDPRLWSELFESRDSD